jgi:hypothetical protein
MLVDAAGRVDRFRKRYEAKKPAKAAAAEAAPPKAEAPPKPEGAEPPAEPAK